MIADFQCVNTECAEVEEYYFSTYSECENSVVKFKCRKCGGPVKKLFAKPHVGMSVVPGYEKIHQGHNTIGKQIDSRNAWV